jgi:hypothetical protein
MPDVDVGSGAVLAAALLASWAAGPVIQAPPPGVITASVQRPVHVPKGHMPPLGRCRIWIPGVPPGQQSPLGNCTERRYRMPPGGVLVMG